MTNEELEADAKVKAMKKDELKKLVKDAVGKIIADCVLHEAAFVTLHQTDAKAYHSFCSNLNKTLRIKFTDSNRNLRHDMSCIMYLASSRGEKIRRLQDLISQEWRDEIATAIADHPLQIAHKKREEEELLAKQSHERGGPGGQGDTWEDKEEDKLPLSREEYESLKREHHARMSREEEDKHYKLQQPECVGGHKCVASTFNSGLYRNGWTCSQCHKGRSGERWFCEACSDDYCYSCWPAADTLGGPAGDHAEEQQPKHHAASEQESKRQKKQEEEQRQNRRQESERQEIKSQRKEQLEKERRAKLEKVQLEKEKQKQEQLEKERQEQLEKEKQKQLEKERQKQEQLKEERRAKQEEKEQLQKEKQEQEQEEKKEQMEKERKAKEEQDEKKEQMEKERKAKQEQEEKKEQMEKERKAKQEQEKKEQMEKERKAKQEQERKEQMEKERKAKQEKEQLENQKLKQKQEEKESKAKEEKDRKEQQFQQPTNAQQLDNANDELEQIKVRIQEVTDELQENVLMECSICQEVLDQNPHTTICQVRTNCLECPLASLVAAWVINFHVPHHFVLQHHFHQKCLKIWFDKGSRNCPECRHPIPYTRSNAAQKQDTGMASSQAAAVKAIEGLTAIGSILNQQAQSTQESVEQFQSMCGESVLPEPETAPNAAAPNPWGEHINSEASAQWRVDMQTSVARESEGRSRRVGEKQTRGQQQRETLEQQQQQQIDTFIDNRQREFNSLQFESFLEQFQTIVLSAQVNVMQTFDRRDPRTQEPSLLLHQLIGRHQRSARDVGTEVDLQDRHIQATGFAYAVSEATNDSQLEHAEPPQHSGGQVDKEGKRRRDIGLPDTDRRHNGRSDGQPEKRPKLSREDTRCATEGAEIKQRSKETR